ncbi:MAG: phosphodiester glycosidase family protein [Clostridium sp.]|jgi:exopolysaccharide biosynthesis protein|uniref:phosphodiester glycosidase family protein n=1 Tax=Clostridium sp. TaxID=1506 RepID=UPI0025C123D1|nr:phosphodiester glycosidase family protein [Clostridium sp.]MCH3963046.1 phosphodiester glycosidase family protein [Clostridium sp.]MCI1716491.1 phosphodiester glycosidase family protein [Clostridium sp.]MCI1800831.1 phosphodiester glycosidase family protein [Clostridium sp.]MCI1814514.1 phosphodiester glycosidase family protein [Clostridium sp.]MCI1871424.1 phosphodiester glycosidase family protein [Clostridium sp.]
MREKKSSGKIRKPIWKIILLFFAFEFVFTVMTAPFLIFRGPFKNVTRTVVGAAMTTLSHQYIAKIFLSDTEIKQILGQNEIDSTKQQNLGLSKFSNNHDSSIERDDISYGKKFKGYMLIIHDPTRVKVGYSKKLGVAGELTSSIAKDRDAVAAVNGGGFTDSSSEDSEWTGTGGKPIGLLMSEGKIIYNDISNPDSKHEIMGITEEGQLIVGYHSINDIKKLNVKEAISFGPALVINGDGTIKSGDGNWGIAPRTAIGQRKDGAILFLVIDGRQSKSIGASLKDIQDIMLQYGAINATNLDGGSSSTMYYEGQVINNPCDPLGERSVPSAVYVEQ